MDAGNNDTDRFLRFYKLNWALKHRFEQTKKSTPHALFLDSNDALAPMWPGFFSAALCGF